MMSTAAMADKTVLIMAGGTGGHVFPAVAVADVLTQKGYSVHWLGTEKGIEASVVPAQNLPIHFIRSAGVRGKGLLSKVNAIFLMLQGLWQSVQLIRTLKPVSVLGMGGFVTVPGGLASFLLRKPLVIQEQNAVAGTANRLLSRFAKRCLEGFPNALRGGTYTGNPVRKEIASLGQELGQESAETNREASKPLNMLVIGGSLGAKPINDILPQVLGDFLEGGKLQVWHQTGKKTYEETLSNYQQHKLPLETEQLKVAAFIDDMSEAYEWADFVLCRAGAISLAEVACAGLPAILVPLPHAIDDHQRKNAEFFVNEQAALMMQQKDMSAEALSEKLNRFVNDREFLNVCAEQARRLAQPQAAEKVAAICLEVANG